MKDSRFSSRVRFNWGFHDAYQCVENGWDKTGQCFAGNLGHVVDDVTVLRDHPDKSYAKGWAEGYRDAKANKPHTTSEEAWLRAGGRREEA